MLPANEEMIADADWAPAVLKGRLVATATDVRIEIGSISRTCRCVGLAEDGFVVESEQPFPTHQVLRCRLRLPDGDHVELFAFAATSDDAAHQEIKPIGTSREIADLWKALSHQMEEPNHARGTGPNRQPKTGVYMSLPRTRGTWLKRLVSRR